MASLPADLFRYNTAVTTFSYCFRGCTKIESIPADLFRYNVAVTNFEGLFYAAACPAMANLPEDLFRYNVNVTAFGGSYGTFESCTTLTSLPQNLFKYNTKITTMQYCFYGTSALGEFTLYITSPSISNINSMTMYKAGASRIFHVPAGSRTETTFNAKAASYGYTIIGD